MFHKISCIHLKGRVTEKDTILWVTPQMLATARPGPGRSQEPETSSLSPIQVRGPIKWGHLLLLSQVHKWRARSEIV